MLELQGPSYPFDQSRRHEGQVGNGVVFSPTMYVDYLPKSVLTWLEDKAGDQHQQFHAF